MAQPSGTETTIPMTTIRKPAPTSARRLVMMTPPCNSACERQLCEKNSARGGGRKTRRKYFGGGIVLGPFCNGRWETPRTVRFLSRGVCAPYRTHSSVGWAAATPWAYQHCGAPCPLPHNQRGSSHDERTGTDPQNN